MSFEHEIREIVGSDNIRINESMKKHTTFRIGGEAEVFATPVSVDGIVSLIRYCKENKIKYYILGNGSNVLVRDEGIDGVVIKIASNFNFVDVHQGIIEAQAGAYLGVIARIALRNSLGGFEFASGIPGTLGGAIIMNAGAYGREMKDVVYESTVLNKDGEIITLTNEQLGFGYRSSTLQNSDCVVLGAKLRLYNDDSKSIKQKMDELAKQRREKQPLDKPNAGSTFKRPEGYAAAWLIQQANLKGYSIGGAEVSTKHAGFIINRGNATAEDVLILMEHVKDVVEQKFGVTLEPEIKII